MAIQNISSKLVAATILRGLEDRLIANRICNTQFTGEIQRQGDAVIFPCLSEPTVSDYTGSVNYEDISNNAVTLNVNQAKYAAFKVSDIDVMKTHLDLKGTQAERAMYMLRREIDSYVLGLYSKAGTTMNAAELSEENIIQTLSLMAQKLEEKNVDTDGMWIAVPPFVKKLLRDAGVRMQINNGMGGSGGLFWTNDLGFDLFVSNNLSVVNGKTQILAGSYSAIAFAGDLTESESIRLEDSFNDAFRALYVFGAEVVKPNELICLPASVAETSSQSGSGETGSGETGDGETGDGETGSGETEDGETGSGETEGNNG